MTIDALFVRRQGRLPVVSTEFRGWIISVYRVGNRHEYQAVAERLGDAAPILQTRRFGVPGARKKAEFEAQIFVNDEIRLLNNEPRN